MPKSFIGHFSKYLTFLKKKLPKKLNQNKLVVTKKIVTKNQRLRNKKEYKNKKPRKDEEV